jgi:plastocyanin
MGEEWWRMTDGGVRQVRGAENMRSGARGFNDVTSNFVHPRTARIGGQRSRTCTHRMKQRPDRGDGRREYGAGERRLPVSSPRTDARLRDPAAVGLLPSPRFIMTLTHPSPSIRALRRLTLSVIGAALAASCGGGGGDSNPGGVGPSTTVSSITLSATSTSVPVGSSVQLSAVAKSASGSVISTPALTWSVAPAGIAAVNASGVVTGQAPGTATVTASANGVSGTMSITVTAVTQGAPTLTVSAVTNQIFVGSTLPLTATFRDASGAVVNGKTIAWTSSDNTRATVSSAGVVTGVAIGSAVITATADGISGAFSVVVGTPATTADITMPGLSFDPATVTVAVGGVVTWHFPGLGHNVNFNKTGAPANIPTTSNQNVNRTFTTAGTYDFECFVHPGMSGTVVVR